MRKGIFKTLSNDAYHEVLPENERSYSSSQLKTMLSSPEDFIDQYIKGKKDGPTGEALDVGNYFHAHFLEPHTLTDFAIYKGARKAGAVWKEFKEENVGKTILSLKAYGDALRCINGTKASKFAMDSLDGAMFEVSLFDELDGIPCKVRFDIIYLSKELSYIGDLKSTRGGVKNIKDIRKKVRERDYDLSAAQYLDMINNYLERKGLLDKYAKVSEFRWQFASKDTGDCREYVADKQMIALGRAKYKKAIELIKKHRANNWTIEEERTLVGPESWEAQSWFPKENK